MGKTISVIVDGEAPKSKGAMPFPGIGEISQQVIDISTDALKKY